MVELAREAKLTGPEAAMWRERIEPRRQELERAARFLVEHDKTDQAVELAVNTWRLWAQSADLAGGRKLLATVLDVDRPTSSRARSLALYGDGVLAFREGALSESLRRSEEALEGAPAVGDREVEALALVGVSRVALRNGDYSQVRMLAARALGLTVSLDASARVWPLHLLAAGTRLAGDYDGAEKLYTESLELNRKLEDPRMVEVESHNLGHVEVHRGHVVEAERHFAGCRHGRNGSDLHGQVMI